jgi:serine/threonine-protein kinase
MPDEVDGYRLHERIGAGGMGEVYKAYNPTLHRWAAIKILYQDSFIERFRNEATIQSSVNHPNIARLYEYRKIGSRDCIVMEYVEGESLDALLRRKKRIPADETRKILSQIAMALSYLHKKEIVHRDIKPQNFKIQPDGLVKMLDFGIAKHKLSPRLTQAGFVVGTMEYLAPEQLAHKPELKSDIWALGVMCYELITGYMPFESSSTPVLHEKIKRGSFTNPEILIPDLPQDICILIERSLRTNPAQRASAEDILKILGNASQHSSGIAGWLKKHRTIAISISALLVLIFAITFFSGSGGNAADPVPEKEESMVAGDNRSGVLISTPGIDHAEIIMPDGSKQQLPFRVKGNQGERYSFIIHADGYADKKVEVQITPRRSAFEYHLDKTSD